MPTDENFGWKGALAWSMLGYVATHLLMTWSGHARFDLVMALMFSPVLLYVFGGPAAVVLCSLPDALIANYRIRFIIAGAVAYALPALLSDGFIGGSEFCMGRYGGTGC